MGPSGSGKTTLLNHILMSNPAELESTGETLIEGRTLEQSFVKRRFGYVTQNDVILGALTVREQLYYNLKMRFDLPEEEYESRVTKIISLLGLDKCAESRIGDGDARGVSGGEKKRVCIALELIADIEVLVLDEPTSGLDT
mmetsp:Transcript_27104/g.59650  ORF Transcript_27104/g.59650 Transcript_27104/m.59650 type:complete len:141 (+) Transcript_27104:116-538(+)